MNSKTSKVLVQVLRKIPLFQGLSPGNTAKILSICNHETFSEGHTLCLDKSPSDEMYILLTGGVSILNHEGVRVASILPVTTICEMGVITGEPRSATVEVNTPSNIFVLPKKRFDHILAEDDGVRSLLYRNVISVMATKLQNDNSRMADLKGEIEEERARTKAAVNMAASLGNLTADEVENRLIHQEENIESEAIDVATGH